MCGILFYNRNNIVGNGTKTISEIFSVIKYRGPDSTHIKFIDNMLFCHHRLAIINTTMGGEQPIVREHNGNSIVLIANGEIYNYKNFTTSANDCDAIIDAYISNKLQELDGDFAFVLYDKANSLIITGRDPVGLKPLYTGYFQGPNGQQIPVAFGSEMKVLACIDSITDVKEHSINTFNRYFLESGTIKLVDSLQVINYNLPIQQQTYEFSQKSVNHYLVGAIKKRINHTNRPYAFLCSGGVDSVLTVAIAASFNIPIHVFTLSLDTGNSFDEMHADMFIEDLKRKYSQVQYTKVKFSIQEGLSIVEEIVKNLETYDPNTIRASIPMYLLAKYISKNTDYKVILSGEGSDELFMGYNYFGIKNPTFIQAEQESLRLIQGLHSFDILRAERCFSCHGLELRVPFLDREMITNTIQIPGQYRLPIGGVEKQLLRSSFNYLGINDRILSRQKERMSDGVGFSWVPSLINHCVTQQGHDPNNLTTDMRMKYEKEYYEMLYNKYYKYRTILFREMPDWAMSNEKGNLLSG